MGDELDAPLYEMLSDASNVARAKALLQDAVLRDSPPWPTTAARSPFSPSSGNDRPPAPAPRAATEPHRMLDTFSAICKNGIVPLPKG